MIWLNAGGQKKKPGEQFASRASNIGDAPRLERHSTDMRSLRRNCDVSYSAGKRLARPCGQFYTDFHSFPAHRAVKLVKKMHGGYDVTSE